MRAACDTLEFVCLLTHKLGASSDVEHQQHVALRRR